MMIRKMSHVLLFRGDLMLGHSAVRMESRQEPEEQGDSAPATGSIPLARDEFPQESVLPSEICLTQVPAPSEDNEVISCIISLGIYVVC